jgi:deoxycytidine triphosphate deaminase
MIMQRLALQQDRGDHMSELNFATSDAEAAERAAKFLTTDPFSSIPSSLLSAAEIDDYARVTGLLFPFESRCLKSASYEVHIGGEFIRWDGEGRRFSEVLSRGSRCVLPARSLTFVQLEPYFRVPYYLALRLSLRATHVHRGLLLGTGPSVDPGFSGRVLIPLHNLTSVDYDLDTTQALVWVEFTKTTFGFRPAEKEASAKRYFPGFPPAKLNLSADAYLRKANAGNPIRHSVPVEVAEAQSSAQRAAFWARNLAIGALVGIAISVVGLATLLSTYLGSLQTLVQGANLTAEAVNGRIDALVKDVGQLDRKMVDSSSAIERRLGDEINKRLDLVNIDFEKKLGSMESDYRTTVTTMRSWSDSQDSRLGVLEAELKGVRERVEKKR